MKVSCERRLVELSCFKALRLCLSSLESYYSVFAECCMTACFDGVLGEWFKWRIYHARRALAMRACLWQLLLMCRERADTIV